MFRVTINGKQDNGDAAKLGDRTLAVFAHRNLYYHLTTYTYTNLVGAGNPNVVQNADHKG